MWEGSHMQHQAGVLVAVLVSALVIPSLAVPVSAQSCSFPVSMTDATGTEVTLDEEPRRVVALSPSAAQTMWEIGAREKVVGLPKHASYLESSGSRTQISTTDQFVSIEAVVDLQPDLVLAPHVISNETVEKLREAGQPVYYFSQSETLKDVYEKTRHIGRLTGECSAAEATVSSMKERVRVAHEAAKGQERPNVLYLFFGYTAGKGTFINEIIEAAGGNNIAADANITGYQKPNPEFVVQANPDWIILNSENPLGMNEEVLNQTTAVQENQTVVVQIEHLNQAAPRIVHAITTLSKRFHPNAYAAANTTATPAPPSTSTTSPDSTTVSTSPVPTTATRTQMATEETNTTGPSGFDVAGATVAIVATAFLVRRRDD